MAQKTPPKSTSVDHATAYAREVDSGQRIAGPDIRNACRRHLNDLRHGARRGLVWDLEESEKAQRFFKNVLKLNGGEFEGQPFELLAWQAFVIGSIYGWKAADGTRRFRVAYIETGKGSGKSPLAAGVGLKGLTADGEMRAEVYAAATKKDQAMILFRDAVAMWQLSPQLQERLHPSGAGQNIWNLAYLQTGSFFRPIASDDAQSGPRPHVGLLDEFHEHKTNNMVEMLRAGTKSRRQALLFIITNSGSNKMGPCWGYHEYGVKLCREAADPECSMEELTKTDGMFVFICSLDEGDDPIQDESCWFKSNPSLQDRDLPGMKYLREQVNEARGMPAKESMVRRLNFCQWTGAEAPWISTDIWRAAYRKFDWEELRGRRAYGGLDLGSTRDLTGLVLMVEPILDGEPWLLVPFAWLPEIGLAKKAERDKVEYDTWASQGHLLTTPGQAVSKLHVAQRVSALASFFEIVSIAYDRWRIEDLKSMAEENGISLPPLVAFGQGYKDMSPAVERFETMLLNGELAHNSHPVLNMCVSNAVTTADDAGNRKPSKERATGRIDLAVAAIMACGAMSLAEPEEDYADALASPVYVR
jgi:phage terminase large subunit-like protein